MSEISREDHLTWCKKRALEYLDRGDVPNAVASMMSDLQKHPAGTASTNSFICAMGLMAASRNDEREARRFIEGFR